MTVLLYLAAAWTIWQLLQHWSAPHTRTARHEHGFWKMLFIGLVLLGINKQLDLQSALTEIGRIMANKQGWYADRQQIQTAFIAGIAIVGLAVFATTLYMIWGAPASSRWALLGCTGLVLFVIVRATSFHHVDAMLGYRFSGVRVNSLLEMGPLLVIIGSAWRRREPY